jgi:hypothetical protein
MSGLLERSCVIIIIGRPVVGVVEHLNKSTDYSCADFCTRATTYIANRCTLSDSLSSVSEYEAPSICFSLGYGTIRNKLAYQWTNQLCVCLHYVIPSMWVSESRPGISGIHFILSHARSSRRNIFYDWVSRVWGRSWGWRNSWASSV